MSRVPANAWAASPEEVWRALEVETASGLSEAEVHRRRSKFGANRLREKEAREAWKILVDQVKGLIVALLVAAAIVAFAFGQTVEAVAILIVIAINAAIGFITELRAVRSMEALRRMGGTKAVVRRGGRTQEIDAVDLVPGDIVVVEAGDSISADIRLVEASKLQADESALTGESIPVSKRIEALEPDTPLAERDNMLFKGTFLPRGSGEGVVVGTGMSTELGRISALVEEAGQQEPTPLEKRLDQLGRRLIWITLGITAVVALLGIVRGKEVFLMIQTGVALAVAAIPEGLPIVATIALARGMLKMARRKVLIRRLAAVETLGATTVICTDKTGTLTENEMTVTRLVVEGAEIDLRPDEELSLETDGAGETVREAIEAGVLCGNASLTRKARLGERPGTGDPMELALLVAGRRWQVEREELLQHWPEVREVAFDPEVKMMATIHESDGTCRVAVKGAPETVIGVCSAVRSAEGTVTLSAAEREEWLACNARMAGEGLRVLALAGKASETSGEDPYHQLTLLGLVGMEDPPRGDVRDAIAACRNAGIRLVMVTGDQAVTARKIAADIGLIDEADEQDVIPGTGIAPPDELGEEDLRRLAGATVFARVSPKQKLDLIEIHRRSGAIVAMTGDGVNDAPALEKADIGVAMGRRGTQVAREAADMVLGDDALSSIVVAVEHGRIIFGNIRKFVIYLFSCNASEVMVVGLASAANAPLPVLPLQILFLNLVTDVFPALALGVGPGDPDVMKRPPRDPAEPVVSAASWWAVVGYAATISAAVLGAQALAIFWLGMRVEEAVTVSFLTLGFAQLWHVFNMRDPGAKLFSNDITRNRVLWGALALCVVLILLAAHVPVVSDVLQIEPIGSKGWLLAIGLSAAPLAIGTLGHAVRNWRRAGP